MLARFVDMIAPPDVLLIEQEMLANSNLSRDGTSDEVRGNQVVIDAYLGAEH